MAGRPARRTTTAAGSRSLADSELVGRPVSVTSTKRRGYAKLETKSQSIHDSLSGVVAETQALMREIGQLKDAQATIERLALTDALTGLANRTLLTDRMNQGLRGLKRRHGFIGVLMLDLDHFKVINDTLGHQVGDAVLVEAARRLEHLARPDDTVARFGGDEFVLLVPGLEDPADLSSFADRVVAGMRLPYRIGTEEVVATASVGVAVTSQADSLTTDLLREADMAMYGAKDRGRDRHEVFGATLQVQAIERLGTERVLRRALADDRLVVEYQPIVELSTGRTVQAEALIRIDDADDGRLDPDLFLGVAAETGLLAVMDEWVRSNATGELTRWRHAVPSNPLERMAINLTARELASPDFTARLAATLSSAGLEGGDLSIEVTEHVLMQTSHSAVASLAELRSIGVQVGLDDFGKGFSALSYLQDFPLDFLKIDRSFVARITHDERSASIVESIIGLAHALGLAVVAEGVETQAQLSRLRRFGCDRGQGWLFAPSLAGDDFERRLAAEGAPTAVEAGLPPAPPSALVPHQAAVHHRGSRRVAVDHGQVAAIAAAE